MTREEFLDKVESEGAAYAFEEYGLHERDLDRDLHNSDFYHAVKNARHAYEHAKVMTNRLYFAN